MGMWSYRALQHFWTKSTIPIPYRGRSHSPGRCASFDFLNKRFSKQEAYQRCQSKLHFPRDKPKKLSSCGKRKWEVCCLMIVNYITNSLKAMTVDRGQLETVKLQWIQFIKADTFQTHTQPVLKAWYRKTMSINKFWSSFMPELYWQVGLYKYDLRFGWHRHIFCKIISTKITNGDPLPHSDNLTCTIVLKHCFHQSKAEESLGVVSITCPDFCTVAVTQR